MPAQPYFVPKNLPRSTTRAQWKAAYRWSRVNNKIYKTAVDHAMHCMLYGSAMTKIHREHLIYELINPPLLLGPGM